MHKAANEADNIKIQGGQGEPHKGVTMHMRDSSFGGAAEDIDYGDRDRFEYNLALDPSLNHDLAETLL